MRFTCFYFNIFINEILSHLALRISKVDYSYFCLYASTVLCKLQHKTVQKCMNL